MIEGVAEAWVRRPPQPILDFVTDLEQYKLADHKIGRVLETRRDGNRVFMRHGGKLRGIPGPPVSLEVVVAGLSVAYRSIPTFPSRLVLTFDGGFELFEVPGGTRVVHTERFSFHAPWRFVADPYLRRWLQDDIAQEMERLKRLLESSPPVA